jgi:NAD(P)-dependent dehydrogenase (short-subunit alcohol dehydrogenase family)
MQLERGQVAVVTGAASGLGRALAKSFATRGLDVVLADVDTERLATAVEAAEAKGVAAVGVPTDVRHAEQVDALAAATLERFGRVDVICNNAGVLTIAGPTWEVPLADWEWILGVNLRGVVHGIRAFVPHLVAQGTGHVVNTASMVGVSIFPGMAPYVASKHAVVALSEGLAAELAIAAPGVGVTAVCPGGMATNIGSSERVRPAELVRTEPLPDRSGPDPFMAWNADGPPDLMAPDDAAAIVLAGIEANQLHCFPNGRASDVRAWTDRLVVDLP